MHLTKNCHPEQREASWCLPAAPAHAVQARTKVPRCARDDN